jgi:hypothetical protein
MGDSSPASFSVSPPDLTRLLNEMRQASSELRDFSDLASRYSIDQYSAGSPAVEGSTSNYFRSQSDGMSKIHAHLEGILEALDKAIAAYVSTESQIKNAATVK